MDGHWTHVLDCRIPAALESLDDLARAVRSALPGDGDLAFSTTLCLEELISNTVLHGLKGARGHWIQIQIFRSDHWLEIRIKDDAPRFDPFVQAPLPNLTLDVAERPVGGLGVHLVKSLMDVVRSEYDGTGNLIVLRRALHREATPDGGSATVEPRG